MKGITLAGYIASILILVRCVLRLDVSVGAFAAVFTSLNTMFGIMEELICGQMGVIAENKPNIDCFRNLLSLPEDGGLAECVWTETAGFSKSALQGQKDAGGGLLEMKQVTFSYPGSVKKALDHIDLSIREGEMIALVGENGAGKSTFAKVLMGLYLPQEGEVRYRGKDVSKSGIEASGGKVSAVMQDFGRYSMTVNENIAFTKDPDGEKADHILDEVGMLSVVRQFKNGKNTVLSKRFGDTELSGGQWQRLAIARGYYKDAEMLILDEPTSAIDPKFEYEIYETFRKMAQGKTAVIITHRLSMARDADRILFLENGRIAEAGNHEALMGLEGKYAYMYRMQKENYR